ncbi:MAG: 5-methyltetrahydropteroyltriglutamate--homocysteine methyltransferase [Candidatus Tectomicrobia bacterium]|nr:5-methyltetrahydropteroyltriglutamate--homocysteine methyltransferase [Candidatus Tectomicrobia bacterium]
MIAKLIPTTVVGSYVQPDWLVDRGALREMTVPRVRAKGIWRIPEEFLERAQDDATIIAIREQERAGIDIITDGEIRRESYSNRFATALKGVDIENPGSAINRGGGMSAVPRVTGKIERARPVGVRDVQFLRANTGRPIKITLPGPFTMTQQAQDDYYGDERALALDYAGAVNQEMKDLFRAGADIVQLDEPYMQAQPEKADAFAVEAINRALEGAAGTTAVHMCFGYAHMAARRGAGKPGAYSFLPQLNECLADQISIEAAQPRLDLRALRQLKDKTVILGVIDNNDPRVESAEAVAGRIREALKHVPPGRLIVAPDCGMKYMDREAAFGKLRALVEGARIVREELGG